MKSIHMQQVYYNFSNLCKPLKVGYLVFLSLFVLSGLYATSQNSYYLLYSMIFIIVSGDVAIDNVYGSGNQALTR